MFDIRDISRVVGAAAASVLAVGVTVTPGVSAAVSQLPTDGGAAAVTVSAAKKATGTLRVVVHRSGTYTVEGVGFRQSATATRTFTVRPGRYTILSLIHI